MILHTVAFRTKHAPGSTAVLPTDSPPHLIV